MVRSVLLLAPPYIIINAVQVNTGHEELGEHLVLRSFELFSPVITPGEPPFGCQSLLQAASNKVDAHVLVERALLKDVGTHHLHQFIHTVHQQRPYEWCPLWHRNPLVPANHTHSWGAVNRGRPFSAQGENPGEGHNHLGKTTALG